MAPFWLNLWTATYHLSQWEKGEMVPSFVVPVRTTVFKFSATGQGPLSIRMHYKSTILSTVQCTYYIMLIMLGGEPIN